MKEENNTEKSKSERRGKGLEGTVRVILMIHKGTLKSFVWSNIKKTLMLIISKND